MAHIIDTNVESKPINNKNLSGLTVSEDKPLYARLNILNKLYFVFPSSLLF